MTKIIELRQDRSLISQNFDGYKLSFESTPVIRTEVPVTPLMVEPNEDQYSLLHAELFSLQNLLQVDPWLKTNAYFINRRGEIMKSSYNESTGRPGPLEIVFQMETSNLISNETRIKGDYNYSLRFVSEKYCVVCDGIQNLILLDTGDRQKSPVWKIIKEDVISFNGENIRNFLIYDSRLDIVQEEKQISLALGHVERVNLDNGGTTHWMRLYLAKWICKEEWCLEISDYLESRGSLYYCAFEPKASNLLVCSNKDYTFHSKKSEIIPEIPKDLEKPQLHDEVVYDFSWSQTEDEIVIKLNETEVDDLSKFLIKTTLCNLNVKLGEKTLMDLNLFEEIDPDLTTWTMENKFLQITLLKKSPGANWPFVLKGDSGPKEDLDKSCGPVPMEQQPIPNLEAPLEDCDFPIGTLEDDVKLVRLNLLTKDVTHTIIMGSTPPLFATNLRPGFPNAFATRVGVDASLWLLQCNPTKPDEWSFRHEGNLHAFGYVQASKQQKKFINCSPDLSYSVISESHRHLFLYKSKYDTANGLRNRSGPQLNIGKQHLIELNDVGEVVGLVASPNVLMVLTERFLLYIQIN